MNQTNKFLGVLIRVIKKENGGRTSFTGSIETPDGKTWSLNQISLTNKKELENIAEGAFVLFEEKKMQQKFEKRYDAINCSFNCEKFILKDIVQYDMAEIKFIFKNATDELKAKLVSKIVTLQAASPIKDVLLKIENIKKSFPELFQMTEMQNRDEVQETQQKLPVLESADIVAKSFLETIFETNTPEYNQNLFNILVEGLKTIDNEEVFQQAKFLLNFNSRNKTPIENLGSIFYHKAIDDYKFRLWFEKLTDYCSTEILKFHFEKAEWNFKTEIIQRCHGNENGFLVLNSKVGCPKEIEDVYFSGIRTKLLQELNEAKKSIFVAIAWFTNDDLFSMLCMKLKQGVRVELIIINDYINNWDYGLPFQTFIDLGGKLYLSEYPSIMHHKFCLIDEDIVFNGSYNWTYYAEMRNDENCMFFKGKLDLMKKFKTEFKKLKSKLGNSIDKIVPFDSSQITKFERSAFKQYFSTDLTLRAETIRKTNILRANELANTAICVDEENEEAKVFQKEIQPEVQLRKRTEQVQNIISEKTEGLIEQIEEVNERQNHFINIEEDKDNNSRNQDVQTLQNINEEVDVKPIVNIEPTFKQDIKKVVSTQKGVEQEFIKQTTTHQKKDSINQINTAFVQVQKNVPVVVENFSIPDQESLKKPFQNLSIAIALDISGSMDTLYKNGTVQKVVEKLLAVALSISSNDQLDIWTFNDNVRRLNSVSKSNFQNYIRSNGITSGGGTVVPKVLVDIDKKYFQENTSYNVLSIILTDGDIGEIQTFMTNSITKPVFWQFVGLGKNVEKLNTLNNTNKNVSFFSLNDINVISDNDLYNKLLSDYPNWYKESKAKGLIK